MRSMSGYFDNKGYRGYINSTKEYEVFDNPAEYEEAYYEDLRQMETESE